MTKKNVNLEILIQEGVGVEDCKTIFSDVLSNLDLQNYNSQLSKMFSFALREASSLFTNIRVEQEQTLTEMTKEYLTSWCNSYIKDRENPALKRPLKNYGEKDAALLERVAANTNQGIETLKNYLEGHFIYMSAENMNGAILEEYLSEVLEPHGWIWCAGSTFRAVDFCYIGESNFLLLQVKNKYNTENSSSSAIRLGTEIKKWNRLKAPRKATGLDTPIPNWESLIQLIDADKDISELLTEEKYLEYIRENSTKELDTLE